MSFGFPCSVGLLLTTVTTGDMAPVCVPRLISKLPSHSQCWKCIIDFCHFCLRTFIFLLPITICLAPGHDSDQLGLPHEGFFLTILYLPPVLVRVSAVVMEHHDQKKLRRKELISFYKLLAHHPRKSGQDLKAWADAKVMKQISLLAPHGFFNLFFIALPTTSTGMVLPTVC